MNKAAEKIRKLLRVAADSGASEHEIELCLARAERLMREHHLSELDLAEEAAVFGEAGFRGEFRKRNAHAARKCYTWEHRLAGFVQEYVGGVGYFGATDVACDDDGQPFRDLNGVPFHASTIVFFGLVDDIDLAIVLFCDLREVIIQLARISHSSCFRGPGASYAQGFVEGLFLQMRNRRTEESDQAITQSGADGEAALILRRDELIRRKEQSAHDWLASPDGGGIRLRIRRARGSSASRGAYLQGKSDGEEHDIRDRRQKRLGLG